MKKFIVTSTIVLSALSFPAITQADDDSGFYLGIGLHRADFSTSDIASADTKGNLSAGYMFNDRWGIDGTSYNFINEKKNNIEATVGGLAFTGIYKFPVSKRVDVYGKAGFMRTGMEIKKNNVKVVDEKGNDLVLGLGAKFDFGKHNVILEYVKVDPKDADLDVVTLGYRYEF